MFAGKDDGNKNGIVIYLEFASEKGDHENEHAIVIRSQCHTACQKFPDNLTN